MSETIDGGEFQVELGVDFTQFPSESIESWLKHHRPKNDRWPSQREHNLWQAVASGWTRLKESERTGEVINRAVLQEGMRPDTFIIAYGLENENEAEKKLKQVRLDFGVDLTEYSIDQLENWLMSTYNEDEFVHQADLREVWRAVMRYCERVRQGGEVALSAKLIKKPDGKVDFEWVPKEIILKKFQ